MVCFKCDGERSFYSLHGEAEGHGRRRVVTKLQGTSVVGKVMRVFSASWRTSGTC